jgi:RimJ/RimL family protein N-acetyltransferase
MIRTPRLSLRSWRDDDRDPFAVINADPEVAYWLGGALSPERSSASINRYMTCIERMGFGRWALERRDDYTLIGAVGIMPVLGDLPLDGFELGWRLSRQSWGQGYAREAAAAALQYGLKKAKLKEVLAFTSEKNVRSIRVMEAIGMARDPARDFDHPSLEPDHPLRRHVVYVAAN